MNHCVKVPFDIDPAIRDQIEFWWAGEKVTLGEFNKRSIEQMRSLAKDGDAIQLGADLHEAVYGGSKAAAQLDMLEMVLKRPLCEACKLMIENMKP